MHSKRDKSRSTLCNNFWQNQTALFHLASFTVSLSALWTTWYCHFITHIFMGNTRQQMCWLNSGLCQRIWHEPYCATHCWLLNEVVIMFGITVTAMVSEQKSDLSTGFHGKGEQFYAILLLWWAHLKITKSSTILMAFHLYEASIHIFPSIKCLTIHLKFLLRTCLSVTYLYLPLIFKRLSQIEGKGCYSNMHKKQYHHLKQECNEQVPLILKMYTVNWM